mgnify:CR=1 FL=1
MVNDCVFEYNNYMRKFKIFISIFTLYEFMMLTILQIPRYCVGIFNVNFCAHTTFKYFLFCIMLPIISCIFFWWIPEISRLFCPRACNATIQPQPKSSGDVLSEIISKKDTLKIQSIFFNFKLSAYKRDFFCLFQYLEYQFRIHKHQPEQYLPLVHFPELEIHFFHHIPVSYC